MIVSEVIKKYTWALVLAAIVTSFVFPPLGHFVSPHLDFLLMILMFLSCLDTDFIELLLNLRYFSKPLVIVAIIHFLSPMIVFLFLRPLFDPPVYLGLILASTVSAGRSIVFLSHIYGGRASTALVISTISGVIGPVLIPLVVWIFSHAVIKTNFAEMSLRIVYLVIIPFLVALYFGTTKLGKKIKPYSSPVSSIILFFIITGIISPITGIIYANVDQVLILTLIVSGLVLINFFLGFSLGHDPIEKITLGISASYKNTTLSTLLALSLFEPLVAIPSIVYTLVTNILLVPLQFLAPKTPPPPQT